MFGGGNRPQKTCKEVGFKSWKHAPEKDGILKAIMTAMHTNQLLKLNLGKMQCIRFKMI